MKTEGDSRGYRLRTRRRSKWSSKSSYNKQNMVIAREAVC
jgi:hypothetical protein